MCKNQLTLLLLLLEEGTFESSGDGVDDELEAVVDVHFLPVLHPDHAPENPWWIRCHGRARVLALDAGVMDEDILNDGRVDPEVEDDIPSAGKDACFGGERMGCSRGRVGDVRRAGRRHRRSGVEEASDLAAAGGNPNPD